MPDSTPHPAALRLEHLTWQPLTRREPTIDALDLEIPAGQRVLLAGASGSGKSTVLRALAGLLDPEDGHLAGTQPVPGRPGDHGLLLQNPLHALVGASIGRDTAFGPENAALPRPEIHESTARALEAAQVDLDAERVPLDASGGQQQRIALAGALALDPAVLLLDEPTSMLDADTAAAVRAQILQAADGLTLVVADHQLEPWLPVVDRVVVLGKHARILADGPPGEVTGALTELQRVPPAREHRPSRSAAGSDGDVVLRLADAAIARKGAGRDERPLVEHLDLELRTERLHALIGPSGAGKSTVLEEVVGRCSPGQVALVPQNPEHSFLATTVAEEVGDETLVERAGLAELAAANPYRLSGGEQRRLAIAAALAQAPRLLVLDEPTVGLDAPRRAAVLELLSSAAADGCAVLVASHDPEVIAAADAVTRLPAPPPATVGAVPDRSISPVRQEPRIPADALNPLTLSLIGILAAIGSFAVQTWQGGLLALLPVLLLGPLAIRTWGGGLLRLLPISLSAAGLAWTTALLGDAPALSGQAWLVGLKEATRITMFVAPGVLALGSVDPTALGDALGGRLRWPARPVAASVAALVRTGHLGRQWQIIVRTRTLRGLGTPRSPRLLAGATFALLVDALRGAEQQALAMDARGFAAATRRTWALPSPLGRADLLGTGIALGLLIWPWVAEHLVR